MVCVAVVCGVVTIAGLDVLNWLRASDAASAGQWVVEQYLQNETRRPARCGLKRVR
jgi:hypothetical protein